MNTSENNAKAFTDAIKRMAMEKCKEIREETDFIEKQRIETFEKDAENRCNSYIEYEVSRINSDKNKEISNAEEESKKELSALRKELTEKVFSKAQEEIKAFAQTDAYVDSLIKSVKEILESASENVVIYLSKEDMKLQDKINASLNKKLTYLESADTILGGVKAVDNESGCLYDNTLDVKFEEQKEWFLENSGLKI